MASGRPPSKSGIAAEQRRSGLAPARWADIAPEHIQGVGGFLGEPCDLCRCEQVCDAWRGALRDSREEEALWRGLCFLFYETMASRVSTGGASAASSCRSSPTMAPSSRSPPPPSPSMLTSPALTSSEIGSPLVGRIGDEDGGVIGELMMPAATVDCVDIELRILESTPAAAKEFEGSSIKLAPAPLPPQQVQQQDATATAAPGPDEKCGWRDLFRMRYLRAQEWDRRRQKRGVERKAAEAEEAKPKADSKFHPSGRAKVTRGRENGREKYHAPRLRTCKRCGVEFDPQKRGTQLCNWHAGRYVPINEDGVVAAASSSVGRDFERRAQRIMKAHNRTKGSKKPNMIVFDRPCETGVPHPDGIVWRWSCCLAESLVAQGCSCGQHS